MLLISVHVWVLALHEGVQCEEMSSQSWSLQDFISEQILIKVLHAFPVDKRQMLDVLSPQRPTGETLQTTRRI